MTSQVLSPQSQRRAARLFTQLCIVSVLLLPAFPLFFLWIAGSIFIYAAAVGHPNPRVGEYVRHSGYRFYGLIGVLVIVLNVGHEAADLLGGGWTLFLAVWLLAVVVVVPLGVRDIARAGREAWLPFRHDMK